jgi:hypothetical protein
MTKAQDQNRFNLPAFAPVFMLCLLMILSIGFVGRSSAGEPQYGGTLQTSHGSPRTLDPANSWLENDR